MVVWWGNGETSVSDVAYLMLFGAYALALEPPPVHYMYLSLMRIQSPQLSPHCRLRLHYVDEKSRIGCILRQSQFSMPVLS